MPDDPNTYPGQTTRENQGCANPAPQQQTEPPPAKQCPPAVPATPSTSTAAPISAPPCPPPDPLDQLQIDLEKKAAETKALQDDVATLAKPEKDADDIVGKYRLQLPPLAADKEKVQCFHQCRWDKIVDSVKPNEDPIKAAIKGVQDKVDGLQSCLSWLRSRAQSASDTYEHAKADFNIAFNKAQDAIGNAKAYLDDRMAWIKDAVDSIAKIDKEDPAHVATIYFRAWDADRLANRSDLKTVVDFKKQLDDVLKALQMAAKNARDARKTFDDFNIEIKHAENRLKYVQAKRVEQILETVKPFDH